MLASDLNNTEFANPQNPDSMLTVEFYDHAALDTWAYEQTGVKSYVKECPFVRVSIPGRSDLTVERPADGADTKRWPRQWLIYQMSKGNHAVPVGNWQLSDWTEIDAETVRKLAFLKFTTVEQLAAANDLQIQGIGMGGEGLRIRAKKAIAERDSKKANDGLAERDAKIEELQKQMEQMMKMISEQSKGKKAA